MHGTDGHPYEPSEFRGFQDVNVCVPMASLRVRLALFEGLLWSVGGIGPEHRAVQERLKQLFGDAIGAAIICI